MSTWDWKRHHPESHLPMSASHWNTPITHYQHDNEKAESTTIARVVAENQRELEALFNNTCSQVSEITKFYNTDEIDAVWEAVKKGVRNARRHGPARQPGHVAPLTVERARILRNEPQAFNSESEVLYTTIAPSLLNEPMDDRPIMAYDRPGNTATAQQVAGYVQVIEGGSSRRRRRETSEEPEGQYDHRPSNLRLEILSGPNAPGRISQMPSSSIDPALQLHLYAPPNHLSPTQAMGPPSSLISRKKKRTVISVNEADETASLVSVSSDRTCQACKKVFKFPRDLRSHQLAEHDGGIRCERCDEFLASTFSLKRHMASKHFIGHSCQICSHVSPTGAALNTHKATKHADGQLCQRCGETVADLPKHKADHHNEGFPCKYCSRCFATQNSARHHQNTCPDRPSHGRARSHNGQGPSSLHHHQQQSEQRGRPSSSGGSYSSQALQAPRGPGYHVYQQQ